MTAVTPQRAEARGASHEAASALRDMLALLALTGAARLVHVYGRTLPDAAAAAVWAALAVLIATALFRRARIRRGAFLAAYVRSASPLARRLRGGWLMAARAGVLGAGLALVLAVALIRLADARAWIVLVASVPVLVLVHRVLRRALAPHVSPAYAPELAWRLTAAAVGALMLGALVALAFHRAQPELGAVSLEQAVWHFADQERARSGAAQILLQMAAAKDGLRLWLAQQLMPVPGASLVQGLGWLIVLAQEAVFVWSYLQLGSAVLIGVKRHDGGGDRSIGSAS